MFSVLSKIITEDPVSAGLIIISLFFWRDFSAFRSRLERLFLFFVCLISMLLSDFFKLSSSSNMLGLSVLSGGIHSDLSTNNFLSWMSSSLLESLIDSRNAKKFGSLTRRENSSNAFWISALSDLRGLGINFRPLERTLISSFVRM